MNERLALAGVALVFVGFFVVLAGVATSSGGSSSTGGFILIGPFPIVFGSGPNSSMLALTGAAITVALVAFYIVMVMRLRGAPRTEDA